MLSFVVNRITRRIVVSGDEPDREISGVIGLKFGNPNEEWHVVFVDNEGTPEDLDSGSSVILGIKPFGVFDGSYLASASTSDAPDGDHAYGGLISLFTSALETALGIDTPADPAIISNDKTTIRATLAIKWGTDLGLETENSKETFLYPVTIENRLNQGTEGVPTDADPAYPSAAAVAQLVAQAAAAAPILPYRTNTPLDKLAGRKLRSKVTQGEGLPSDGSETTLFTQTGAGMVIESQFTLEGGGFAQRGRYRVYVDGEAVPSIDCDIGQLAMNFPPEAHAGPGGQFSTDHLTAVLPGSTRPAAMSMSILFPMPFSNGIRIALANVGVGSVLTDGVNAHFSNTVYQTFTDPASVPPVRLCAANLPAPNAATFAADDTFELLRLDGIAGWLVWFAQYMRGDGTGVNYSFLERDVYLARDSESVTFDSDGRPLCDYVGDGTEDAPYRSSWYFAFRQSINTPFTLVTAANNSGLTVMAGYDFLKAYGGFRFNSQLRLGYGTEPGCTQGHSTGFVALYYRDLAVTGGAPTAPTILSAQEGMGSGQIKLTFGAPQTQGGSPITGYAGTYSPGSGTFSAAAGSNTVTVSGLTNGTEYTFTLRATNAAGNSPYSSGVTATPTATVYDADAQDYFQRILNNNGTIGSTAKLAANAFVGAAKAHDYWDKLDRISLTLGDQMAAAVVPLKIGAGADVDFPNGNPAYAQSTGVVQTGSSIQFFTPGLHPSAFSTDDIHLAIYCRLARGANPGRDLMGVYSADAHGSQGLLYKGSDTVRTYFFGNGGTDSTGQPNNDSANDLLGFVIGNTDAAYLNGVAFGSSLGGTPDPITETGGFVVGSINNTASGVTVAMKQTWSAYSFGTKLTTGNITDYTADMETFQDALGRGVV